MYCCFMESHIPALLARIAGLYAAALMAIVPVNAMPAFAARSPARNASDAGGGAGAAQVNVTQFHNHASRDGLYVDSAFTPSAAANLGWDLNFDGTIVGNVYAQPLYIEGGRQSDGHCSNRSE